MNAEAARKPDIYDASDEKKLREAPYNLEAEQAVLGAILMNNEAFNQVNESLRAEDFYAPVHQRIYGAMIANLEKGLIANPVTIKHVLAGNDEVEDDYLARLVAAASSIVNIPGYSRLVADLSLKRRLIMLGEEVVNEAYEPQAETDGMQQIEQAEQKLFNLATDGTAEGNFKPFRASLSEAIRRTEFAYKNKGNVVGVSTGLLALDRLLGGMQPSDLLILAGRPSMGKTALATNVAYNAAKIFVEQHAEGKTEGDKPPSVGFFSLEMSGEQLAMRILASACNMTSTKLQRGELDNDEFAELVRRSNELSSLPFHIDDTPALSISALRTRARRLKRVHNLGLLVVDYLQLVHPAVTNANTSRVQEVSQITQGLKAIAKELNIPVVALSQLSRAVEQREDKRPQLADLRESGSIEQDADVVMFIFREEYYEMRKQPDPESPKHAEWQEKMERLHGKAEVIIAKQRNGPIGVAPLQFSSEITQFSNLADDDYLPERHF